MRIIKINQQQNSHLRIKLTVMTINERFTVLIDTLYGGNKRAFANASGISPTVVENIVGSRHGKPSFDVLTRVCSNANISERWLISGEGEMLKASADGGYKAPSRSYSVAADSAQSYDSRPRLPISAAAGALSQLAESVETDSCEYMPVVAAFPRYDFTITIDGDSMEPDYHSGDELACAFVSGPADVKWGKPHILDTTDGVVFKRIFDGGKSIMCNSINKRYGNFEVDKADVLHIAAVVGVLRHTAD